MTVSPSHNFSLPANALTHKFLFDLLVKDQRHICGRETQRRLHSVTVERIVRFAGDLGKMNAYPNEQKIALDLRKRITGFPDVLVKRFPWKEPP